MSETTQAPAQAATPGAGPTDSSTQDAAAMKALEEFVEIFQQHLINKHHDRLSRMAKG